MEIGLIVGAFGIKGEVRILSLNDEPERFRDLEKLTVVGPDGNGTTYTVEKVRVHKKHALVKFREIADRTASEKLKDLYVRLPEEMGEEMTVAESARVERDRLVGIEVYTVAGVRLGVIEEVIRTGANDVYEVVDGKSSVLLPAISEVIVEVDLENGRMVVDPLPGLL